MPLDGRKVLAFSSAAEIATGVAAMVAPAMLVELLLGTALTGIGTALARCFGIALIALGVACWPGGQQTANLGPGVRAMLIYNTLIALYLAYLFVVRHHDGVLLWPAVALHAAVALVLALALKGERKARALER
jgi:Ca2+/Na+ antiporter